MIEEILWSALKKIINIIVAINNPTYLKKCWLFDKIPFIIMNLYKVGVYMILFRLVLVALLGFVLFNLYRVLTHKPKVKGLVVECLLIILALIPIYIYELDYIDKACLTGNPLDFYLILIVGISCLITIIVTLQKGD